MRQFYKNIEIHTSNQNLINVTPTIRTFANSTDIKNDLLDISILHTTASLIIQENNDPNVLEDIKVFFFKIVTENEKYKHYFEGLDDMPGHIKSCLTNSNLTISILEKKMVLGVWQNIYLFEHRYNMRIRNMLLHTFGE